MAGDISAVSLSLARRLSPSLILQPELTKRFFHRAESGALASVIQACPQGGKTTFLKQLLHHLEDKNNASKTYDSILWINIQTSISADKFISTLAALVGSKEKTSDPFELLENSNAIVFVDNFDLIENHQTLLDALKNTASKLRLIASVTRLPDISSDLAFEVLTESYEGLSKTDVLSLVQKFNPAADDAFSEHAWTMTRGNPYLLRALLTAPHFDAALEDYWTKALSQIHAKTLTQIQKAALTEISSHRSEAFFLTPLNVAERKLLRQLGLITEGSLPSDLRLHDHARTWLKRTTHHSLRNDIILDLKNQTQNLALQEELAWQYQKTDDPIQSALVCESLLPRLYDQFKFKTIGALTEACWQYLTPITWNWRRLSIVNSSQSLAEVNAIIQTLNPQNPHLPTWHGLRLLTISRLEDWSLFLQEFESRKDLVRLSMEGHVWALNGKAYLLSVQDQNLFGALKVAEESYKLAREYRLHPRIQIDVLMSLVTISGDAGNNRLALKYSNEISRIASEVGLHIESPVFYIQHFDYLISLGKFSHARETAQLLPSYEKDELMELHRLQMMYIIIHSLCLDGFYRQADQACRRLLPDHMISKITPSVFRIYETLLQSRITVGAILEVLDVLRSFTRLYPTLNGSSRVLADTILQSIDAIDSGSCPLSIIWNAREKVCSGDLIKILSVVCEYQWTSGKILFDKNSFRQILSLIDTAEFPYAYYQLELFAVLFATSSGHDIDQQKLSALRTFFEERNLPLGIVRTKIAQALNYILSRKFDEALSVTQETLSKYSNLESEEDISWLRIIRGVALQGLGKESDALNVLNSVDLMSNASKSEWFLKAIKGKSIFSDKPTVLPKFLELEPCYTLVSSELKVVHKHGSTLIQDRPVLVRLLKCLLENFPQVISKEEMCSHVWNESYNPLVHDTRIYTSIRRLRDILKTSLGDIDPIMAVDGCYKATDPLVKAITIKA